MKIKFIKEFKYPGFDISSGAIKDSENYGFQNEVKGWFQWLIDNGFAEEVKESGWWKPEHGETYWCLNSDGDACQDRWLNCKQDRTRTTIGNVFKTKAAAERYRDYLKAIATVRQDEGVLTPAQINELRRGDSSAYHVGCMTKLDGEKVLFSCAMDFFDMWAPVGSILFDTMEHTDASIKKHPDEWKTIASYDWSRE